MAGNGATEVFDFDDQGDDAFYLEGPLSVKADPSPEGSGSISPSLLTSSNTWDMQGTPPPTFFDSAALSPAQNRPNVSTIPLDASWDSAPPFGSASFAQHSADMFVFGGQRSTADFAAHAGVDPSLGEAVLTPAAQEQLRRIAMPPHLHYESPQSSPSPDSASDGKEDGASSPEPTETRPRARKRNSSALLEDGDVDEEDKPAKRANKTNNSHNMIEKRYRMKLNDQIQLLRESVPSLRIMSKSARGEDTSGDREELHGLTPAHKLNKATVRTPVQVSLQRLTCHRFSAKPPSTFGTSRSATSSCSQTTSSCTLGSRRSRNSTLPEPCTALPTQHSRTVDECPP